MPEPKLVRVWAMKSGRWAAFSEPRDAELYYETFLVAIPANWSPYFSHDHGAILYDHASKAALAAVTVAKFAREGRDGFSIHQHGYESDKARRARQQEAACNGR